MTNASETKQAFSDEALPTESREVFSEDSGVENQDDIGYDEPRCNWKPTQQSDDDCGDGLDCPPCG